MHCFFKRNVAIAPHGDHHAWSGGECRLSFANRLIRHVTVRLTNGPLRSGQARHRMLWAAWRRKEDVRTLAMLPPNWTFSKPTVRIDVGPSRQNLAYSLIERKRRCAT